MTILAILAALFGLISGSANFIQSYKIFRTKSAHDISVSTYSLFFMGSVVWIFYGLEIGEIPVILSNSLGFITTGLVLVGWYLYGRK